MLRHGVVYSVPRSTVFLADASPFDCELLSDSLAHDHLNIVGWACTSAEVVAGVVQHKPAAAVISTRLRDGHSAGYQALREVCRLQPDTRVAMLLDSSKGEQIVEAFRAGAVGVFSRNQTSSNLRKCIHRILAGEIWAGHQELAYVIEELRRSPAPSIANSNGEALLTRREGEVVRLVMNGLTNREIATQLQLSEHTIKNHMFDIFEKLGISTRVELVLYALNAAR